MQRTRLVGTIVSIPTSAGTASSVNSATCVRLFNDTSGIVTVSVSPSVGSATTFSFSMPAYSVEFLEKLPSDVIFSSSAIQANQVGFTN